MTKVIPPVGKVDLVDKDIPIFQWEQEGRTLHEHYAYVRSEIDMTAWKRQMDSIPLSFWREENQTGNVRLVRPAHDAWGIDKIVFTFCDDFLQKIIDLPYAYAPEWQPLLHQVYASVGVDPSRVVRSLLARMPAGAKIPVHHDTGYWVKHTHRCHLAVETSEEVEFMVGPTVDKMRPYAFDYGKITELNNQAKHAVTNNMKEGGQRIHLIFDYVDEGYQLPERITLKSGDIVHQTRRSIDLASDCVNYKPENCTPRFIVIGAQKCGTTSMYEYLSQHPLVVKSKRRETHNFDWTFNKKIPEDDIEKQRKWYLNYFDGPALKNHPSLCSGESTPSYLLHSDVVLPRLLKIVPWTYLVVMLRNPVDRAYSQYQMIQDPTGTPEQLQLRGRSHHMNKTFEQVLEEEMKEIEQSGITSESTYQDFRDKLLSTRPMNHGGHSLLIRGMYALQLLPYFEQWPKEQLKIVSMKEIQGNEKQVRQVVNNVFEYMKLPAIDEIDLEPRNTRKYTPMLDETRQRLEIFFEPYNKKLFELLGKELVW